jgi:hypothetical protein
MKTRSTIAASLAVLLIATAASGTPCSKGDIFCYYGSEYGWTISASSTDPFSNTSVATFGVATYYLWLQCSPFPQEGMTAAEFDLVASGPIHLATVVINGFLNAGGTSNLLLAVGGCPGGPVVAAHLLVLDLPGSFCIAPSANGIKGVVDCEPKPSLWPMNWIGLAIQNPVSVDETTWGRIKERYR